MFYASCVWWNLSSHLICIHILYYKVTTNRFMDNSEVTFVCANSAGEDKVGFSTCDVRMKDSVMAADFLHSVLTKANRTLYAGPQKPLLGCG
jgi:hypothetical protein